MQFLTSLSAPDAEVCCTTLDIYVFIILNCILYTCTFYILFSSHNNYIKLICDNLSNTFSFFLQIIPIFGDCPIICRHLITAVWYDGIYSESQEFMLSIVLDWGHLPVHSHITMKNGLILPNQYSVNFKCREYLFSLPGPDGDR